MHPFTLHTIVLDDYTGASHDLARVAFLVDLTQTDPSAKKLSISNFDQVDTVFRTQCFDEFNVLGLRAGLDKDA